MVQRNYKEPNIGVRDTREVQRMRVEGADTRPVQPLQIGNAGWEDQFLASLTGFGAKIAERAADIELSNQYMEGAAQAGVIESEEELQADPLTRDWKVAGYRDTMGKLALADLEAQFQSDLPTLREKDGTAVEGYLRERRSKMMPALSGMSREARQNAMGQMLLQDRAATKKWATEHTKFIIDTKAQAITTQMTTANKTLTATTLARAAGELTDTDYQEALRGTAGVMVGSIWGDSSLPVEVKQELTFESISNALQSDNVALYNYLNDNEIKDGQGGTLVSRLDGQKQSQLAGMYREAMNRTKDKRNFAALMQVQGLQAMIDADKYNGTADQLLGTLEPLVRGGVITAEKSGSIYNKFLDTKLKSEQGTGLFQAATKGDLQSIYAMGKTPNDAVTAGRQIMAKNGVPVAGQVQAWLSMGQNGLQEGYAEVGKLVGASVRQIVDGKAGEVLPQHLATFEQITASLRGLEGEGRAHARVSILSGASEDNRMFLERVLRGVDNNESVAISVQRARDVETRERAMSPSMRAAKSAEQSKEVEAAISNVTTQNWFGKATNWVKGMFGSTSATAASIITPTSEFGGNDGWFSTGPVARLYGERARAHLRQAVGDAGLMHPEATPDELVNKGMGDLAARTIKTESGPIFLPRNMSIEKVFGLGPGNQADIGPAIDRMVKPTVEGGRVFMEFSEGGLYAQEYDRDGTPVGTRKIELSAIRDSVMYSAGTARVQAEERLGKGRAIEQDGVKLAFNGMSTAGVPTDWMFSFRENLVAHEGVRRKAYNDLSGNKDRAGNLIRTVGVGVSSHNPNFPKLDENGNATDADIAKSFASASNAAARAGADLARELGRNSKAGFSLLSELAYQSGEAFMSQKGITGDRYRVFGNALRGTDPEAAKAAFKSTAAWYYSRDPKNPETITRRQQSYLTLIDQTMKGN